MPVLISLLFNLQGLSLAAGYTKGPLVMFWAPGLVYLYNLIDVCTNQLSSPCHMGHSVYVGLIWRSRVIPNIEKEDGL